MLCCHASQPPEKDVFEKLDDLEYTKRWVAACLAAAGKESAAHLMLQGRDTPIGHVSQPLHQAQRRTHLGGKSQHAKAE